jgi:hypothetical protein
MFQRDTHSAELAAVCTARGDDVVHTRSLLCFVAEQADLARSQEPTVIAMGCRMLALEESCRGN